HMVGSERYISNAVSNPAVTYITVANNTRLRASAQGIVVLKARGSRTHITLNDVLIVQNLRFNLLSAAQLMDCGVDLSTDSETRDILLHYTMLNKTRKQIGRAHSENGIYTKDKFMIYPHWRDPTMKLTVAEEEELARREAEELRQRSLVESHGTFAWSGWEEEESVSNEGGWGGAGGWGTSDTGGWGAATGGNTCGWGAASGGETSGWGTSGEGWGASREDQRGEEEEIEAQPPVVPLGRPPRRAAPALPPPDIQPGSDPWDTIDWSNEPSTPRRTVYGPDEDPTEARARYMRTSRFRADDVIWHQRLGHPSRVTQKKYIEVGVFAPGDLPRPDGTKVRGATHPRNCTVYFEAALSHQSFPLLKPETNRYPKLHKVYNDFLNVGHCGISDELYMLTFVDAATRYIWIVNVEARSRAYEVFRLWLAHTQRQSGEKLKIWQSDGAVELRSKELQDYLAQKGIEHHISLPYAHQQQGVPERTNRTLMTKVRALMKQSKLPPTYWTYAMHHAVRVHNLLSTTAITGNSSPHVKWTGTKGDTSMLRVWGCMVQYCRRLQLSGNLQAARAGGFTSALAMNTRRGSSWIS
ncbi:unnamed protein product, partial [Closterium sp. NIES-54]